MGQDTASPNDIVRALEVDTVSDSSATVKDKSACRHCGDPCPTPPISRGEDNFCCVGCATVFDLLQANGLGDFYQLDEAAGRSQQKRGDANYDWLDVEELATPFVQYRDNQQTRVALELPQIHCTSCVWLLERLPRLAEGVHAVTVNFSRRTATIVFRQDTISFRELAEWLARIGYPPVFHERDQGDARKPRNRRLIYQIGLAGFTFGNVMLLSFPEYLGLGIDLEGGTFARAFGYLNLALSVPLLLYSGQDYLRSAWSGLRAGMLTIDVPISVGLLALFGRSTYEVLTHTGAGYFDSLAGLLFFLLVGRWFQDRTFDRLSFDRDYRHYFPIAANRYDATGAQTEPIALADIKAGDWLLVRPGELIPADGKLLNDAKEGIDYSFVTGEAEPQPREAGDQIYAGGRAVATALDLLVEKPVDDSYLLQLWRQEAREDAVRNRNLTDRISQTFTLVVLSIALLTFLFWWPTDAGRALNAATAVLIIACPCALALAIPFTYGSLIRQLGKHGLYLRSVAVVEALHGITDYVLDKTGTLTEPGLGAPAAEEPSLDPLTAAVVLAMVRQSNHPKSAALGRLLAADGVRPLATGTVEEIAGKGLRLDHQGIEYRVGSASFCGQPQHENHSVYVTADGELKAAFSRELPRLREGALQLLDSIDHRSLHLLSGDEPHTGEFWMTYFDDSRMHFRQSPFDKQRYIKQLQGDGQRVLMLGDGLNDAGALRTAEVGVAVSEDMAGFSPACDGILSSDALPKLPEMLRSIKRAKMVLYVAYALAFLYNVVGLSFAVRGLLSPVVAAILMPLSSISIVVVGIAGTNLVARR
ncbi:heavy metal translocating P-type ATPase metal-binding domain-containing protein [Lewinella sp. W8]|uniref:heavy metal translocating P-type ATPase n=1 Tax=Lewinella sp. W8 TaxID=2528208 RepID=UPI0010689515|nr:heavy metal translocating P-type ATPase metal-binding domain-containing protein [Lewinella sp. W8]MTB51830.1 HAD-IC family P-type ATPase [Lewinella sp. W8]